MAREAVVQRNSWIGLAGISTLFRTNSGKGFVSGGGKPVWHADGSVTVPHARPLALGLAMIQGDTVPGLTDTTGWTSVVITPDMVGRRVAVFTAIEFKETDGGRKEKDQVNYVKNVAKAGGIAGFASSPEEAKSIVQNWVKDGRQPPL